VRIYNVTDPFRIAVKQSGGNVLLTWPTNIVCRVQAQTNPLSLGIGNNWSQIAAGTNQMQVTPLSGGGFFDWFLISQFFAEFYFPSLADEIQFPHGIGCGLSQTLVQRGWLCFTPEVCQLCNSERATADDGFVGPQCWSQVRFIRPPFCDRCGLPFQGDLTTTFECTNCREMKLHFSSARSAVVAKTVVLEAIHRFKYSRALWFEPFLADLLNREATPVLRGANWDFIVPVPLHPLNQREREFNQAEILAQHLSVATKHPVECKLLQRITPTATPDQAKA